MARRLRPNQVGGLYPTQLSTREATFLAHADKAEVAAALSNRSFQGAAAPVESLNLPHDTSDLHRQQFQQAFPDFDFVTTYDRIPHHYAAKARQAAVKTSLPIIARHSAITLVGPSFEQYQLVRAVAPTATVHVFQPLQDGRDVSRWGAHQAHISHPVPWSSASAVASSIIVAFLSVGSLHPSEFFKAARVAVASEVIILHHFAPESLVSDHYDEILQMSFTRSSGDDLLCALRGSTTYVDSLSCIRSWLNGHHEVSNLTVTLDVLREIGSLKLLHYKLGHGPTQVSLPAAIVEFDRDYRFLPACVNFPDRLISTKVFDKVLDYLSRQEADKITPQLVRNRVSALSHRVAIGSSVLQEPIIVPEAAAAHLAEITSRIAVLRHAALQEERDRLAAIVEESRDLGFVARSLRNADGKFGAALFTAEAASRLTARAWTELPRLSTNWLLDTSIPALSLTPISGFTTRSVLGSKLTSASTAARELASLERSVSVRLNLSASISPKTWAEVFPTQRALDFSARVFLFHLLVLNAGTINELPRTKLLQMINLFPTPLRSRIRTRAIEILQPSNLELFLGYTSRQLRRLCAWLLRVLDFGGLPEVAPLAAPIAPAGEDDDDDDNDHPRPVWPGPPPSSYGSDTNSEDGSDDGADPAPPRSTTPAAEPATAGIPPPLVFLDPGPSTSDTPNADDFDLVVESAVLERTVAGGEEIDARRPTGTFAFSRALTTEEDLSPWLFEVGDIYRPFDEAIEDTLMDRRCNIPAFETFEPPNEATFATRSQVPYIKDAVAGPHTLFRGMAYGLYNKVKFSEAKYKNFQRSVSEAIRASSGAVKSSEHIERHDLGPFELDRESKIKASVALAAKKFKMPDVVVDGLPAAGKSALVEKFISKDDLIIVPTTEQRDKWQARLKEMQVRAHVKTFDNPFEHPGSKKYRLVVIEECFLFEIHYIAAFCSLGSVSLAVGDSSQIRSFHLRQSKTTFHLRPAHARLHISANFSLGLPAQVLALGKALGIVDKNAITANPNGQVEFVTSPPDSELNIVFNRANKTSTRITAHESQGKRATSVVLRVRDDEIHFMPRSGHFWVGLSRSTDYTALDCEPRALLVLLEALSIVDGWDHPRYVGVVEEIRANVPTCELARDVQTFGRSELIDARDRATDAIETLVTARLPLDYDQTPAPVRIYDLSRSEVNDALSMINCNFEGRSYYDVVDSIENLSLPGDPTVKCSFRLDLQATQTSTSSVLQPAGILFASDDTKTEIFTIDSRYLANEPLEVPDQYALAMEMFHDLTASWFDPTKLSFIPQARSASHHEWLSSRDPSVFRVGFEMFLETRFTAEFHSFLKAHAKAKNSVGFGLTIEKGQTIAAGPQSYNAAFTHHNRSLVSALQQVLKDNVCLDIGYSDRDFEAKVQRIGAYSRVNTQIDLSSQDSTHRECHVLVLIFLLALLTDATPEELQFYYTMRSRFIVRAKSFSTSNLITYEQEWTLPSGDPLTLIANCVMEGSSTAYVFKMEVLSYLFWYLKGDDQWLSNLRLLWTPERELRRQRIGVIFKIDLDLPPFAAGRFILPDNTVHHDPVKHVAKYSIKNMAPEKYQEYVQAYTDLFPPISDYQTSLVELYCLAHHPTLSMEAVSTCVRFAQSLKSYDFLVSFQRVDRRFRLDVVDVSTDCARAVIKALGMTALQGPATPARLRDHFILLNHPYRYRPYSSRSELRSIARLYPNTPVFSLSHCVCSHLTLV
jgi:hypothetical protein